MYILHARVFHCRYYGNNATLGCVSTPRCVGVILNWASQLNEGKNTGSSAERILDLRL